MKPVVKNDSFEESSTPTARDSSRSSDTREALLSAAERVFARKGYDGATVKELADSAGVNVSLVSYYFGGKEGLYRTCLERFGRNRLAAAERVLKPAESIEDFRVKLRLFVEEVLICHTEQSNLTSIIHRELSGSMAITQDLFRDVFGKIARTLEGFIESAQIAGIVREDLDAHASTTLFFGGLVHISRVDRIHEELFGTSLRDRAYRDRVVNDAVKNFVSGVTQSEGS